MKELLKSVLFAVKDTLWLPLVELKDLLGIGIKLILAIHMWCIVLVPYLTMITFVLILSVLFGKFPHGLLEFTRVYFYDGTYLYFTAWRIHLVVFIFCLIESFRD